MENETEAVDVFVLALSPSTWLSPPFLAGCLSFSDIIAFLSVFVPFGLPLSPFPFHTHSHINTESYRWPTGSHYVCDPRLLYGGLVLKMGIYCSP